MVDVHPRDLGMAGEIVERQVLDLGHLGARGKKLSAGSAPGTRDDARIRLVP